MICCGVEYSVCMCVAGLAGLASGVLCGEGRVGWGVGWDIKFLKWLVD